MSQEPQNGRDDLSAARHWLDKAADGLPPEVYDSSNYEHVLIAAMLGEGYSSLAHYERWDRWRKEDLARAAELREADLARLAAQREEDIARREAEAEQVRERETQAVNVLRDAVAAAVGLPHDWRAVFVEPGTPYIDELDEEVPSGWYVVGGRANSNDPEAGVPYALRIEEGGPDLDLEKTARLVAARLNGGQA